MWVTTRAGALGAGYPLPARAGRLLAQEDAATNAVLWQLADNRGTARDVVDSDGALVTHLVYESFGALTSGDASVTRYQFTGREWDADLELFYYRARWYSPVMRRFISEDPSGLDADLNSFRYVWNSPTLFTDPTGLVGMGGDGLKVPGTDSRSTPIQRLGLVSPTARRSTARARTRTTPPAS